MQITYTFPAMTTVLRRSAAQAALCVVKGAAVATLAEISRHEAPVAATIQLKPRDGGEDFRFYDGRFYVCARGIRSALRDAGGSIVSAICDELISRRRHAAAIQPRGISRLLWSTWSDGRRPEAYNTYESFEEAFFEDIKPFDEKRHDGDQFYYWKSIAEGLVSRIVLIDGEAWQPTPEPVMRCCTGSHPDTLEYDNAGVFEHWRGRPADLSKPYGKSTPPGFLGQLLEGRRYWKPGHRFLALPEADALAGDRRMRATFRLVMPEVFTVDVLKHEMNRAARLAVAAMKEALVTSDESAFIRFDEDLAYHLRNLGKLTIGKDTYREPEELEDAMAGFLGYTKSKSKSPYNAGAMFAAEGNVGPLVQDILIRWNNREVDLDFIGRPMSPQPRS